MTNREDTRIRRVRADDVGSICSIVDEITFNKASREQAGRHGFLVSGFSRGEYEDFVDRADYFYLIEEQGRVRAFLLAYSDDRIQADEWVNNLLRHVHPDPFILLKQIFQL